MGSPTIILRPDHHENTYADIVAALSKFSAGETIGDRATGDIWLRTSGGLKQISSGGVGLVTPIGGYAGPEGTPVGAKLTVTASNVQSAAIVGTLVDVIADKNNTLPVFILFDGGTGPAVVDTSYPINPGESRRFPITSGNILNAICSGAGPNYLWWHLVEGDA